MALVHRILQANEADARANTPPFFFFLKKKSDALVRFYVKFKAEWLRLAVPKWTNVFFFIFILFI